MKLSLLALPAALLVGCAESVPPQDTEDQSSSESEGDGGDPGTPARDWYASPLIYFPSCDAPVAQFEADGRYAGDAVEILENYSCLWKFDDGTTYTGCAGEHVFAEAGWHDFTVEVTNLDTGEVRSESQRRYIDPPIEATLDVTGDDLSISWIATVNVSAEVHVFVEPYDQIIVDDPGYHWNREYTLAVKEPGTYTVILDIEDERPSGPICSKRIEKQITLVCDGDGHVH